MKRYIACLAVVLTACSSPMERDEETHQDAPAPPAMDLSPSKPYMAPCDRPPRYKQITIDGKVYSIPIFVMCDPNASDRDLGDPPPDKIARRYENVSNPNPVQR